jgi:CspA family cold shock protein
MSFIEICIWNLPGQPSEKPVVGENRSRSAQGSSCSHQWIAFGQNFTSRPIFMAELLQEFSLSCFVALSAFFFNVRGDQPIRRRRGRSFLHGRAEMPQGKIKRLVADRGFGFIDANQGEDLFFHHSAVEGVTFEDLQEGQEVEFEIGRGPKGVRAESVRTAVRSA